MNKPNLAFNNLQWLICHKTKPNLKMPEENHHELHTTRYSRVNLIFKQGGLITLSQEVSLPRRYPLSRLDLSLCT